MTEVVSSMDIDDGENHQFLQTNKGKNVVVAGLPSEGKATPWVEKYRPQSLADVAAHRDIVDTIDRLTSENRLPHLLLYGPPGTGKTSTILAVARKLYGAQFRSMILELNASDDRGIDVVRQQIQDFASTQSFSFGTKASVKLVLLDEADAMTKDAQFALRRVIEKYTKSTRFALICNHVNKIIPALQSRCTRFRFAPLDDVHVTERLKHVIEAEGLDVPDGGLVALVRLSNGDMRKALNILQSTHMACQQITEEAVYLCTGNPLPKDIEQIAHWLLNEPFSTSFTSGLAGITVDKSVEFSYEELAKATDNFNIVKKIGQGGFGTVYYAELRGERTAIKKMDMQASKEFLAELKVLTHVHHLNLVRLIGFCVEGSLFLVYEFIENGNLSQHLRGREPLSWSTRVQIALDSARGLEYIHEHTVPVYIHCDIKSANILIDKNYRGKVADFGLTKLTGSASLQTQLVGTFGYMPPEYAQYGDVSSKVDVYAFGVVMYELISAKDAIVKTNELVTESRGLVALFEDVINQPDPRDDLCKLVDPRLEDNYPIDSVRKMAQLARACTHENPQLRPSMRSIVVALMTLSSSTEDWDVGSFYENQALVNLMSGR